MTGGARAAGRRGGATLIEAIGALAVAAVVLGWAAAGAGALVERRDDHRILAGVDRLAAHLEELSFGPWPAPGSDLMAVARASGADSDALHTFPFAATVVSVPRTLTTTPMGHETAWDRGVTRRAVADGSLRALSVRVSGVDEARCIRLLTQGTAPRGGRLALVSVDGSAPADPLADPSTSATHFHPPGPRPWAPRDAAAARFPVSPSAASSACGDSSRLEWVMAPRAP